MCFKPWLDGVEHVVMLFFFGKEEKAKTRKVKKNVLSLSSEKENKRRKIKFIQLSGHDFYKISRFPSTFSCFTSLHLIITLNVKRIFSLLSFGEKFYCRLF